ncbi:molybdopterin cofactor-binding domain-containing protein [Thermodesulfobacteriota bacterium]
MSATAFDERRRNFLKLGAMAGMGLVVGCSWSGGAPTIVTARSGSDRALRKLMPNAWIRIDTDDNVTVMINHSEMGQGITTALAMVVAEELEVEWQKIRAEQAPVKPEYVNPRFGVQATGGSTSVQTCWDELRKAGAATRQLFIGAAASTWRVPHGQCRAENGKVVHKPTGRIVPYGQLIDKAASRPVPIDPPLKKPEHFKIIGKRFPRLDSRDKTTGRAVFGTDVELPGLLIATTVHPPVLGGRLRSFNASKAKAMSGVRHVLPVRSGVAVVADSFWQAKKAAGALELKWDKGPNADLSMDEIWQRWEQLAKKGGDRVRDDGDVDRAFAGAARLVEAVYRLPFQAHACPEPMNCTAHVTDRECDVWVPTQNQGGTQEVAAALAGLHPDSVRVHTTFLGGGFGRRGYVDFVAEAVEISKRVKAPVKVIWTREEDMLNDRFRPASYHVVKAALDKNGKPVAMSHLAVGHSFIDGMIDTLAGAIMPRWLPRSIKNVAAGAAVPIAKYAKSAEAAMGGAATMAYGMDHIRVEYIKDDPGVPIGAWRGVSNTRNAFVVESFMDELAAASGKDPVQLRYDLLKKAPKRRAVLELAATKAGWGKKLPDGVFRGISVHAFHDTPAAMVAEISIDGKKQVKVHRVVCAVHCGTVINPKIVEAQMAGAIAFGITGTLKGCVTIKNGRAQQTNFDDFPLLTIDEMPEVEVHMGPSTDPPTGIGEVGVPPIAPALANAVFAATGKRIRKLPIMPEDLA